jgi:N-methylhydantoinase A
VDDENVRVGVDIGGTFTDVVTIRDGTVAVTKAPSTPDAPEEGVIESLRSAAERAGFEYGDVSFLAHGTTVATNAVLEREWADTALITTEGFRDALEIGRQTRPDLYDLQAEKPTPIVERDRRFEVPERLDERGTVLEPLDEEATREVAREIADSGVDSVAVSLLFSFEDDDHERRVAEIVGEEIPGVSVSLSSVVLPEIREYERTLATALNAGLKPVMEGYVGELGTRTADLGVPAELKIMQSNGGIITADVARERPVNTLLSGPAAGVQGAAYVSRLAGMENVITMDMGGTSCDVSLVRGGDPVVSTEVAVGDYPVSVPMIDVHTIGAGGGSIAWVDAGGALRVGPRSAGADPGPICYGRGGEAPTVTDAHFLLGRIDPERFVSGEFGVEEGAVRAGVERVAEPLDMTVEEAAQGILDVANANMERALRVVSVERGHDPREFGLVAFGGAGPLHATTLAAELDVPRVVVPRTAGVLSALGLLISDLVIDYSTSRVRAWADVSPADLDATFAEFERQGQERLADENLSDEQLRFERAVDLRYRGQSFDLRVPVPDDLDDEAMDAVARQFHDRHEARYGHASPDEPLELVTVRLRARGVVEPPDLAPAGSEGSVEDAVAEQRTVTFDGQPHETWVYDRARLPIDGSLDGPAVVEGPESTIVVRPDQRARVDGYGNVVVELD